MAGISLVDGIPGDEYYLITAGIAVALLELGTSYSADKLTEAMIGDSVTKFQSDRAKFICMIAKGKNAAESKQNVQSYLAREGYPGPIQWIINSLLNDFYNIVFYTPDWWPGFDEYLTSITEVCCDGLTDGNLIEPGSAQACRGANFVLDGLVGCLTAADMYVQNYSRTSYNSLSGTEAAMLANVQANYFVPDSIVNKAWSWQLSQAELARYMYAKLSGTSWLVPGSGVSTWEMGRLGAHLQTEIAICELRDCETAQAAYELLAGAIDAWLAANVTDQALLNHIRLFCQGLIHPAGAYIGLLFTESADLAGFAGSSDCSGCGASSDPCGYVYIFDGDQSDWSYNPRVSIIDSALHFYQNPETTEIVVTLTAAALKARIGGANPLPLKNSFVHANVKSGNFTNRTHFYRLYDSANNLVLTKYQSTFVIGQNNGFGPTAEESNALSGNFGKLELVQSYSGPSGNGTLWDNISLQFCGIYGV